MERDENFASVPSKLEFFGMNIALWSDVSRSLSGGSPNGLFILRTDGLMPGCGQVDRYGIVDRIDTEHYLVRDTCVGYVNDDSEILEYPSILKIDPYILDDVVDGRWGKQHSVDIRFLDPPPDDLVSDLSRRFGLEEDHGMMSGLITISEIVDLSFLEEVRSIDPDLPAIPMNDVAIGIMGVTPCFDTLGLDGTGQIVAVCDSGLDTGSRSTIHPDFADRIIDGHAYARENDWSDIAFTVRDDEGVHYEGGHGTHVAGSICGSGAASGGKIRGCASNAGLVFQSVQKDGSRYFDIPDNCRYLDDAYNAGARVHSNSWGTHYRDLIYAGRYDYHSWELDHFIWNHDDLVVCFSAGNEGEAGLSTLNPQSCAKNVISVGASENLRPNRGWSSDNSSHVAYFSSKGPTKGDSRVKPDVVAPGTWILSTRSSFVDYGGHQYWAEGPDEGEMFNRYAYMGGTSCSNPLVSGMAVLIRQYFEDFLDHVDPSAALVKAALINGARPLSGKWSSIPNNSEGWGLVNLTNSICPPELDAGTMFFEDNRTGLKRSETFSIDMPVTNSSRELLLTLVWTDYPGYNSSSTKLVNDLDLVLVGPDGVTYNGNDVLAPFDDHVDSVNNVERIIIEKPRLGKYTVSVIGRKIDLQRQTFALVASGGIDMEFSMKFHPFGLDYEIGRSEIVLNWMENFNLDSSSIIGYNIYRGTSPEDLVLHRSLGNVDSFLDVGIENKETYYYHITTVSIFGESLPSEIIAVRDDVDPVLLQQRTDLDGYTGDPLSFSISAKDDVLIESVFLEVYKDGDLMEKQLMQWGETFTGELMIPPEMNGSLRYYLNITDISGNTARYLGGLIDIFDNDAPVVDYEEEIEPCRTGSSYNLFVNVSDNRDIANVSVEYWYGDYISKSHYFRPNETEWNLTVDIPSDAEGFFCYIITARDSSFNTVVSDTISAPIIDVEPPKVDPISPQKVVEDQYFELFINTTDNRAVSSVVWYGCPLRSTEDYICGKIDRPGTYDIVVEVKDTSGNKVRTNFTLTVEATGDDEEPLPLFWWGFYGFLISLGGAIVLLTSFLMIHRVLREMESRPRRRESPPPTSPPQPARSPPINGVPVREEAWDLYPGWKKPEETGGRPKVGGVDDIFGDQGGSF
ncbi:MAG: S8 family serine peptidase [Thermoplasmatota archaeon]